MLLVGTFCETITYNLGLFKYVKIYYMYIEYDMTSFDYLIGAYIISWK